MPRYRRDPSTRESIASVPQESNWICREVEKQVRRGLALVTRRVAPRYIAQRLELRVQAKLKALSTQASINEFW